MTLDEARRVLGLGPEEEPDPRMEEFVRTREQLAEMVRTAPNETIAERYRAGLEEFDAALAALREEAERRRDEKVAGMMALVPGSVTGRSIETKRADFHDEPAAEEEEEQVEPAPDEANNEDSGLSTDEESGDPAKPFPVPGVPEAEPAEAGAEPEDRSEDDGDGSGGLKGRLVLYTILFLLVGGLGGGWFFLHGRTKAEVERNNRLILLEGLGTHQIENRRWEAARNTYEQMEALDPGSEVAREELEAIREGRREEQQQFVAYQTGEAIAAFEAGRFEDARVAADRVLARYPDEEEVAELRERIDSARNARLREDWTEKVRAAIEDRDWDAAESGLATMATELPGDEAIAMLAREIAAGREQQRRDHERAHELADAARLRDPGKFDAQALDWMREAISLAPGDEEIRALYDKLASYSRTLRVPEDVPNLRAALERARDRDRVVLGEGRFPGGVVINTAVQLEGAGAERTILESAAREAPALTFGPGAEGATVSGLQMRQTGFEVAEKRFPAVQVRGGGVNFADCTIRDASGHGLEILDGGHAEVLRCTFANNGWDGVAARGEGSRMTVRESVADGNFGHGFEIWDGAVAEITDSTAKDNIRNGILIDSDVEDLELRGNKCLGNREYGIQLASGASGEVTGNACYGNLLGGMLVRFASMSVMVEDNDLEQNSGPGLLLEDGLRPEIYEDNRVRANADGNVVSDVTFDGSE